jgi:hypothetical protein
LSHNLHFWHLVAQRNFNLGKRDWNVVGYGLGNVNDEVLKVNVGAIYLLIQFYSMLNG